MLISRGRLHFARYLFHCWICDVDVAIYIYIYFLSSSLTLTLTLASCFCFAQMILLAAFLAHKFTASGAGGRSSQFRYISANQPPDSTGEPLMEFYITQRSASSCLLAHLHRITPYVNESSNFRMFLLCTFCAGAGN